MVHLNSVYQLVKISIQGKVVLISVIVFLHLAFLFPSLLEHHGRYQLCKDPPPPPLVNFCQLFTDPSPSPLRGDIICERSLNSDGKNMATTINTCEKARDRTCDQISAC